MELGLLSHGEQKGRVTLAVWVVGLFSLAVAASATVRSVGGALVLAAGPIAVLTAVLAQLAGVRSIARYRTLFVGLVTAFFAVLLGGLSLLTGIGSFALLGFGASLLAGTAAVLS